MATVGILLAGSGRDSAFDLVRRIIRFARERGIDQASLARRAGISQESLSRLKKRGGCRLATALELARAAGLAGVELVERGPVGKATAVAARELSAGRPLPISGLELALALRAGVPPDTKHRAHLCGFFEELPVELVHDVALDEGLDYRQLAALAEALAVEGETVEWLQEMAGDGLA